MKHKRKGFTLIELVAVLTLVALVSVTAFTMVSFSIKVFDESTKEYEFQFSTRSVLNLTSDMVRYATAVFTVPESKFDPDNLTEGWDYIGMVAVELEPEQPGGSPQIGHQIVKYSYDSSTGNHNATVIVEASADIDYKFVFEKTDKDSVDSMLSFTVYSMPVGRVDEFGQPKPDLTITSEVKSQNSLQVKDWGTEADPAIAVAFMTAERSQSVVGNIAMVLDTSGSMAWAMGGSYSQGRARLSILKEEATTLINAFAQEDNMFVSLVPFATSANDPGDFYSAKASLPILLNEINNLDAIGGTNTGDGLRRAYWNLVNARNESPPGVLTRNYLIVLVDGVTTFATVNSNSDRNFFLANGNVNEGYLDRNDPYNANGQIAGNGSSLDAKGTGYVNAIGSMLQNENVKVYVIGFSALSSELASVNDIAAACGADPDNVFIAGDQNALNEVFNAIQADIVNDLSSVIGPF